VRDLFGRILLNFDIGMSSVPSRLHSLLVSHFLLKLRSQLLFGWLNMSSLLS
jgi:hypothetical protein